MITKTALIHFIMMFSPAASSLATRVWGEGSVHFQRNIVIDTGPVYQAAGHSPDSPALLQPECSILMFTILLFSRIRTFGYLPHHHPAAAWHWMMLWRAGVMLWCGAAPCHAIGLSSQLSGWLFRMQTAGAGQVPLRLGDASLYLYCTSNTFSVTSTKSPNHIYNLFNQIIFNLGFCQIFSVFTSTKYF